ncbi:MAG: 30S ribosomal protein S24e [Promethearchaeota archaeon]
MEIEIIESKDNPLLRRKEIKFRIREKQTPERVAVKEKLAAMHNADFNLVFIRKIQTRFGTPEVTGYAMIYEDEQATKSEPEYIRIRNLKKEERNAARKEYLERKRMKRKKKKKSK